MLWNVFETPITKVEEYYPGAEWVDWVGVNVYSVPYFGSDGVISGCISTSLPEAVIQSRLTEGRFVVRCVQDSVTVTPSTPGLWQQEHGFLARGEPDPTLLYSEVLPLRIAAAGPSWLLWAGKENTKFEERSDVRSARSFRVTGWAVCFGMVASMLAIAWLVTSHRVRTEAVNRDLEQHVAERTRELISANDALQIANAKAEAGSRAKSEFLANMSHEIRTPMTAILGYADLLIESEQTQEERQMHVRTIRRNGDHLLAIINDILDLSKIEAGKLRIERIQTSPMQILEHVASLMRVRASEKHLGFHVEVLGAIPETISSDPTRLRQILLNLTGNAVKFTLTGELRITMQMATSASAEHPRLKIAITDSGIGMRKEQIDTLFVAFSQADASTTRRFGGTGLGLVITRHLAQLLGGDVTVQSRYGEGSTFEVTIATGPLQGVRMLDTREQERADLDPKVEVTRTGPISARVLLAEDGPDNQRLISLFLRRAGATVTVAGNGRIACEFVERAAAAGEPFDVILMDMQMPEMDGYAAAGELRKKGHRTPIIALTAHAMEGDREKCIAAGCSDYATKPIQRERLLAVLRQHLP